MRVIYLLEGGFVAMHINIMSGFIIDKKYPTKISNAKVISNVSNIFAHAKLPRNASV